MRTPSMRFFGSELRRAREAAGVTQRQLAEAVLYSESKVGAVERGEQFASPAFAERADGFLDTGGLFARMRDQLLAVEVSPEWFRPWLDYEREASEIGWYEPLLVPGLLQTEAYARVLLESGNPDQAESLLAARMERQQVLDRAAVVAIIDESVLRRRVGDPAVMHAQLTQLAETRAVVQVRLTGGRGYLPAPGRIVRGRHRGRGLDRLRGHPGPRVRAGQPGGSLTYAAAMGDHPGRGAAAGAVPERDRGGGGEMEATPVTWRKSSRSGTNGGGCVEVATTPEQVMVRDSKDRSGPVLTVPAAAWQAFLATLDR